MTEFRHKKNVTLRFKAEVTYEISIECDKINQAIETAKEMPWDYDPVEVECVTDDDIQFVGVDYLQESTEEDEEDDDNYEEERWY